MAVYTSVFSMGYGLKSSFNICIISACVSLLIKSWITLTEAVGGRAESGAGRMNEGQMAWAGWRQLVVVGWRAGKQASR